VPVDVAVVAPVEMAWAWSTGWAVEPGLTQSVIGQHFHYPVGWREGRGEGSLVLVLVLFESPAFNFIDR